MNPINFVNANITLGKDQPEYENLPAEIDLIAKTIVTYWEPTKEELVELFDHGAVKLTVSGITHPPVTVEVVATKEVDPDAH